MKSVSVIIPTYNRAQLITRAIWSVLDQEYTGSIEVIIIDDCSNDSTRQVVAGISDQRIRYVKLSTRNGACAARNTGILEAKGELIAFLDSDDFWLPGKLARVAECFERVNADVVFHAFERRGLVQNCIERIPPANVTSRWINTSDLLPGNMASTQTLVFDRNCIQGNLFDPCMPRFQDWELMLRLCLQNKKIFYLNEVLAVAEVQEDSITRDNEKGYYAFARLFSMLATEYKKLNKENQVLMKKVQEFSTEAQESSKELQRLKESKSWRITAPLRKLSRILKRKSI